MGGLGNAFAASYLDRFDLAVGRPLLAPIEKSLERLALSNDLNFDPAIGKIFHPTTDFQLAGERRGGVSKADSLHLSTDQKMNAFHGLRKECHTFRALARFDSALRACFKGAWL